MPFQGVVSGSYVFPPPGALWTAANEGTGITVSQGGEWNNVDASGTRNVDVWWDNSTELPKSGSKSLKTTIDTTNWATSKTAVRLVRQTEIDNNQELYFSVWYYIPQLVTPGGGWNLQQIKSTPTAPPAPSDPIWVLGVINRPATGAMCFRLSYHGSYIGETDVLYEQAIRDIPVGQWFHVEWHHVAATGTNKDGRVQIWQDGVELFDKQNVYTRYPNGALNWHYWSVNNYATVAPLSPFVATLYIDDVAASLSRVGPTGQGS